jgi:hypothetical protein
MKVVLASYVTAGVGPVKTGNDGRMDTYSMRLRDDRFIHFTTMERATAIVSAKKLLMRPPHKKFGGDAVYAISLVWGSVVPRTQTTHIGDGPVGVIFKTATRPKIGVPEEVVWEADVSLQNVAIVKHAAGVAMLKQAKSPDSDDFYVTYV